MSEELVPGLAEVLRVMGVGNPERAATNLSSGEIRNGLVGRFGQKATNEKVAGVVDATVTYIPLLDDFAKQTASGVMENGGRLREEQLPGLIDGLREVYSRWLEEGVGEDGRTTQDTVDNLSKALVLAGLGGPENIDGFNQAVFGEKPLHAAGFVTNLHRRTVANWLKDGSISGGGPDDLAYMGVDPYDCALQLQHAAPVLPDSLAQGFREAMMNLWVENMSSMKL